MRKNCKSCGKEFEDVGIQMMGRVRFLAATCSEECDRRIAGKSSQSYELAQIGTFWEPITPKALQMPDNGLSALKTAIARHPKQYLGDKTFLVLAGPCRTGKTWTAYQALKSACIDGKTISAIRAASFSAEVALDWDAAAKTLKDAQTVDYLLIDDFCKAIFSPRFTQLLFVLIDSRAAHGRKTIITLNVPLKDLFTIMQAAAPLYAEPILSRINESMSLQVIK
jgi:DNA replication protein DnaC